MLSPSILVLIYCRILVVRCSRCRRGRSREKFLENEESSKIWWRSHSHSSESMNIQKISMCVHLYISTNQDRNTISKVNHWKEHLWLVRFTGSFFRITLATTAGQLASLFHWRRGLSTTLILKGREFFLAGLARQDMSASTTAFTIECWIHLSAGLLFDL